jgi:hypothetical protein
MARLPRPNPSTNRAASAGSRPTNRAWLPSQTLTGAEPQDKAANRPLSLTPFIVVRTARLRTCASTHALGELPARSGDDPIAGPRQSRRISRLMTGRCRVSSESEAPPLVLAESPRASAASVRMVSHNPCVLEHAEQLVENARVEIEYDPMRPPPDSAGPGDIGCFAAPSSAVRAAKVVPNGSLWKPLHAASGQPSRVKDSDLV